MSGQVASIENLQITPAMQSSTHSSIPKQTDNGARIIFFDSSAKYQTYQNNYHYIKAYPHLLALKVNEIEMAGLQKSSSIIPASYYTSQSLKQQIVPDNVISEVDLNNLRLDGYTGKNITVGVLDNGIDFTHPLLSGKMAGKYFAGIPNLPSCATHGTPVSGLIAGRNSTVFSGMAVDSQIYDIEFSCSKDTIEGDFLDAFDQVIAHNDTISIINTSFGGVAPVWDPVMKRVVDSGVIVVGSAGNGGPGLHTTTTGGPGNSIHGISVGAISGSEDVNLFSSRGPAYEMTAKPDLLAPGSGVLSTSKGGGIDSYSGTSFSSPIVAGGIAVLLDALKSNNINFNPGLIKAALMNTARSLGDPVLTQGKGIIQFNNAFEYLLNQNTSDPQAIAISTSMNDLNYLDYIPQGAKFKIPLSLISSNPVSSNLSFSGDFTGKTINYHIGSSYSQHLGLEIDTSEFSPNTEVNGTITASLGQFSTSLNIQFTVGNPKIGTVGIDRGHTYWDQLGADHIGGSNTGQMIRLAQEADYEVTELFGHLNDTILSTVDILWMPDTINRLDNANASLRDEGFNELSLSQADIKAIHHFVSSGGSLFITTLGAEYTSSGSSQEIIGLNTTAFNPLVQRYGIEAQSVPTAQSFNPIILPTNNQSSLIGSASKITHNGNYLNVHAPAWSLIGSYSHTTLAYYQNATSNGKVVVASTNFWMDNHALGPGYSSQADDKLLSSNLWTWFSNQELPVKLKQEVVSNHLQGAFTTKFQPDPTPVTIYQQNQTEKIPLQYTMDGQNYSFELPVNDDGNYRVVAKSGDSYLAWNIIRDRVGPSIEIASSNANNTNFKESGFVSLEFIVTDDHSGVDETAFTYQLNGSNSSLVDSYNADRNLLKVVLQMSSFTNNTYYTLRIGAKDLVGNYNAINYHFGVNITEISSSTGNNQVNSGSGFLDVPNMTIAFAIIPVVFLYRRKHE